MLAYCKLCVTYYGEFNSNDEGIFLKFSHLKQMYRQNP